MKFMNFRHQKHNLYGKLRYFTKVAFGAGKRKSRGISDKSRKIVINRDRAKLTSLTIFNCARYRTGCVAKWITLLHTRKYGDARKTLLYYGMFHRQSPLLVMAESSSHGAVTLNNTPAPPASSGRRRVTK